MKITFQVSKTLGVPVVPLV